VIVTQIVVFASLLEEAPQRRVTRICYTRGDRSALGRKRDGVYTETLQGIFSVMQRRFGVRELTGEDVREFGDVLFLELCRDGDELIEPGVERPCGQRTVFPAHAQDQEVAVFSESSVEALDLLDRGFARSQHRELDLPLARAGEC
jgi:hypothetical protein